MLTHPVETIYVGIIHMKGGSIVIRSDLSCKEVCPYDKIRGSPGEVKYTLKLCFISEYFMNNLPIFLLVMP